MGVSKPEDDGGQSEEEWGGIEIEGEWETQEASDRKASSEKHEPGTFVDHRETRRGVERRRHEVQRGKGRKKGQPDMGLRMESLLEKIKRDFC